MRRTTLTFLLAAAGLSPAYAQIAAPVAAVDTSPISDMETLVVSGVQPGPGMWKVSKGDHVMWVLGVQSPLPKKMQWVSRDVEEVLAQAQEVIWPTVVAVDVDIGFFQGALLAPKAFGARKNPNGASLHDVVSPQLYARWQVLKKKYVGRDNGIEKWRPMFAAMELYKEAMDDVGLRERGIVGPVLGRMIKGKTIKQTSPMVQIKIADPKAALAEFSTARLDDLDCFSKTLSSLESDLDVMRDRANAWAIGNIETLRGLPYPDLDQVCMDAAMQTGAARKRGMGDLDADEEKQWFAAAEKALATNAVTFSTLPMRELLSADGYLAKLQAKGFQVEAP